MNIQAPPKVLVTNLAKLAQSCGLDGVVNSLKEVRAVRNICGNDFLSITPGIRPQGSAESDDQKRVGTPKDAANKGSSAIVVGRPILQAKNPLEATIAIKNDLR